MIRVVEVLATLQRAGAETMAVSLASGVDRTVFEPVVISLYDAFPGGLEPVLADCGVPVRHLGKTKGFDGRMWPRLARAFRELRPDIIHTHSYVLRYVWPAAGVAGSGRIVHTVHNLAGREVDWLGRMIHRAAFRSGAVAVAVAGEVAASFEATYGFAPAATIPNGIDTARFHLPGARERWRRANGFDPDEVLVVSVARLDPQKNPRLLAEVFARIGAGRLLLAGDGKLRGALENRDRIHVLGVRSDMPELLSACDIFALASDWEGHPIAVMEAMAAGLPVVATAVGGVPEIVGDAGLLAPAGDAEALERSLRRLIFDAELRARLGRASRERARALRCEKHDRRLRKSVSAGAAVRVALLTTNLARGGAETQVFRACLPFAEAGARGLGGFDASANGIRSGVAGLRTCRSMPPACGASRASCAGSNRRSYTRTCSMPTSRGGCCGWFFPSRRSSRRFTAWPSLPARRGGFAGAT